MNHPTILEKYGSSEVPCYSGSVHWCGVYNVDRLSALEQRSAAGQSMDQRAAASYAARGYGAIPSMVRRIHGLLGIFQKFLGIFRIFGQILGFLAPGRSESCRRLRDLQKSVVILSNGAVWTRNLTLLMKTLPP